MWVLEWVEQVEKGHSKWFLKMPKYLIMTGCLISLNYFKIYVEQLL